MRTRLLLSLVGLTIGGLAVNAQDWKDALRSEKAQNTARIAAIDAEGAPLAAQLRAVTQEIKAHNDKHPNGCIYPEGHPEVCAPWVNEADKLNKRQQPLLSRLEALTSEQDRLITRNKEIDRRLKCVPIPNGCRSDSDCHECSSCATFDGRGTQGVCQPRP
jgi:hypothetical protein